MKPLKKILVSHEDSEVADCLSLLIKAYSRPLYIRTMYRASTAIHMMGLGMYDVAVLPFRRGRPDDEQVACLIRQRTQVKRPRLIGIATERDKGAANLAASTFDQQFFLPHGIDALLDAINHD